MRRKASQVSTSATEGNDHAGTGSPVSRFGYATHLSCRECGLTRDLGPFYACEECFGPLDMWRYAKLLPVPPDTASRPTLDPGYARLIRADNLAHALGMRRLWIK